MANAKPLIGAHMPTSSGCHKAISNGVAIGCDTVQIFTASPRQWRSPVLKDDSITAFLTSKKEHSCTITIAHDSYLINLAAAAGDILTKSHEAFRTEIERAEALEIDFLVSHPGAHGGDGEEVALKRLIESIDTIHQETAGAKVRVAIETTAGQGTCLGNKFEHIAHILNGVKNPERLAVCMDTCHIFAAGYDIRDEITFQETMEQFDRIIGLKNLAVIHANDSQKGLGSRVDRHAHIGEGEIGIEAFRLIVNDQRFAEMPIIIETPESETMHEVNIKRLRDLIS